MPTGAIVAQMLLQQMTTLWLDKVRSTLLTRPKTYSWLGIGHRIEANTVILLNEHINKLPLTFLTLYPKVSTSLSLHQSTSFCSRWWLIERPTIGQCIENKTQNRTSISYPKAKKYCGRSVRETAQARSHGCLQQNICWTWQGHCTDELHKI